MSVYEFRNHRVEAKDKLPSGPHWAVLVFEAWSRHVPGDERSRTNPGHGYPEHTETGVNIGYYAFTTKDEWVQMIRHLETEKRKGYQSSPPLFAAIEVSGVARITTNVAVDVTTD